MLDGATGLPAVFLATGWMQCRRYLAMLCYQSFVLIVIGTTISARGEGISLHVGGPDVATCLRVQGRLTYDKHRKKLFRV